MVLTSRHVEVADPLFSRDSSDVALLQPDPTRQGATPAIRHSQSGGLDPSQALVHVARSLPLGVELHRSYQFVFPLGKQRKLDLLVLKIHCPFEYEREFQSWRSEISSQIDPTSILIRRVRGTQSLWNNLRNRFAGKELLTQHDCGELRSMLDSVCGERPYGSIPKVTYDPSRKDLTSVPFIAIDSPGVKDIEDLVYARENRDGSFTFKVALIDATDYVKPGSELDAHALRIGSTIYTRNHSVPTLPAELAHDMLSFHPGQVRPAWVLEVKICPSFKEAQEMPVSRSRHYTVQYDVSRAYVKNHRNIDPLNVPALDSHSAFARCLASLAQVARIMRHSRASKPTPTRVDKPAPLAMIVAEIMIETKCLLSTFVGQRHGLPMIYRVHERPSMEVRERFHRALNTLRIPNTVDDLASPSQFAGILVSLEQRRDPKSQALLNDLLDTFLIRSLLSTNGEIGHFGLNVPRFGNWKPRDADGLTNQYQLLAATGQAQAMSAEEIAERVEKLNDKRWTRDERTFNAIFLESLLVRLALTDTVGTGTVHEVNEGRLSVMMNGFSKPASLQRVPKGLTLEPGEPIIAKLRGFNLRTKAYEFALLRRTSA